jgi:hypothetical protein
MDYKSGTELWKHQWGEIQDPDGVWFDFWQDEEDGEAQLLLDLPFKLLAIQKWIEQKKLKEWLEIGHKELQGIIYATYANFIIENEGVKLPQDMKQVEQLVEKLDIEEIKKIIDKIKTLKQKAKDSDAYALINQALDATENASTTSANNAGELATITEKLIQTNEPHQSVLGLLFEFKYGIGSTERTFDNPNSVFVKNLKTTACVDSVRQIFYRTRFNSDAPLRPIAAEGKCEDCDGAGICNFSILDAFTTGKTNIILQYIGSYSIEVFPNKERQTLLFAIENTTHIKSLLYHMLTVPANYERQANTITPLGAIKQTIKWEEPIDNTDYINNINK